MIVSNNNIDVSDRWIWSDTYICSIIRYNNMREKTVLRQMDVNIGRLQNRVMWIWFAWRCCLWNGNVTALREISLKYAFLGRMFCWKFSSGERLSAGRFVKQAFYRTFQRSDTYRITYRTSRCTRDITHDRHKTLDKMLLIYPLF